MLNNLKKIAIAVGPAAGVFTGERIREYVNDRNETKKLEMELAHKKLAIEYNERIEIRKIESHHEIEMTKIEALNKGNNNSSNNPVIKSPNEDNIYENFMNMISSYTDVQLYGIIIIIITLIIIISLISILIDSYIYDICKKYKSDNDKTMFNKIKNTILNINLVIYKTYNTYNVGVIFTMLFYMLFVGFKMLYS